MTKTMMTAGGFNRLDARCIRFLHETARAGRLHVILFSDALVKQLTGEEPKYSESERRYFLESVRYVEAVHTVDDLGQLDNAAECAGKSVDAWRSLDREAFDGCEAMAQKQGIAHEMIAVDDLTGYPEHDYDLSDTAGAKKVLVTGCYDWFHSGHVRFFEEASEYGDLYVVLGHDKNLEKLKGPGHPMFPEDERRYLAGSIRFVKQALISSGDGWLDAEPEIRRIKPDIYLVNEDGDRDVKRQFCEENGLEYVVLKREPKPGLKRRSSTDLRGF